MKSSQRFGLGERVKIAPQHWLRGGEVGRLIRFQQRGQNNWLVKFDNSYPGGGIDGDKLWFDARELTQVTAQDLGPEAEESLDEDHGNLFAADLDHATRHLDD